MINQELSEAIHSLPPLPYLVEEILLATVDDTVELASVAEKIALEPVIAARVVAIANSAFCVGTRPIHSIEGAIARLGLNRVRMLTVSITLAHRFDASRCPGFRADEYWYQSVATAGCTAHVSRACTGRSMDAAYLAGLLHNIGLLLLACTFPVEMSAILEELNAAPAGLLTKLTRERLGIDHHKAGQLLLTEWGVPADVVAAVACTTTPARGLHAKLVEMVRFCADWTASGYTEVPDDHTLPLTSEQLRTIEEACLEEREQLAVFAHLLATL